MSTTIKISTTPQAEDPKVVPTFTSTPKFLFNALVTVDNPFLQAVVDTGAIVYYDKGEGFSIMAYSSLVYIHIHKTYVNLECISTPVDERGKGSATKTLTALVALAKETKTTIRLRATNVERGWVHMGMPLAIMHGYNKKGKIPVTQLVAWYKKFGFEVTGKKTKMGTPMEYKP